MVLRSPVRAAVGTTPTGSLAPGSTRERWLSAPCLDARKVTCGPSWGGSWRSASLSSARASIASRARAAFLKNRASNSATASETLSHAARPIGTHHHALMCRPPGGRHIARSDAYRPLMTHCTTALPGRQGRRAARGALRPPLVPRLVPGRPAALVAGPVRCWTGQMTPRPRRRDSDMPGVPPAPGALGVPAAPARKPARRRTARLARTLRTRWWPRFLLAGVLLVVVGATLLSGVAEAWVVGAGAAIIFVIALRSLSMSPADYRREGPMPPGAPGPGS